MFIKPISNNILVEYERNITKMLHNKKACVHFIKNENINVNTLSSLLSNFVFSDNTHVKVNAYHLLLYLEKKKIVNAEVIYTFLCKEQNLDFLTQYNQINHFLMKHIKDIYQFTNSLGKKDGKYAHSIFFEQHYNKLFHNELIRFIEKMKKEGSILNVNKDFYLHNDRIFKEIRIVLELNNHKDTTNIQSKYNKIVSKLNQLNVFDINVEFVKDNDNLMVINKKYDFFILTDKILNDFHLFKSLLYQIKNDISHL